MVVDPRARVARRSACAARRLQQLLALGATVALAASCGDSLSRPASGLLLRPDSVSLPAHSVLTLEPVFVGGAAEPLAFYSSDPSVAAVDSLGVVRARWPGSAVIRGQATHRPGLAAQSRVTVTGPALRLEPDSLDVAAGFGWRRLTVQTTGAASGRVSFQAADAGIARVDSTGLVCPVRVGRTFIRAAAQLNAALRDSALVRVVVLPPPPIPAGMIDVRDSAGARVGSGPARGVLQIVAIWLRWVCDQPDTLVADLSVDGTLVETSGPRPWVGTDSVSFRLDTRALDAAGRRRFPDGSRTLQVSFHTPGGPILMAMGTSISVANGSSASSDPVPAGADAVPPRPRTSRPPSPHTSSGPSS